MRIAVGGFLHESHSFAPRPATWPDFLRPGGFPSLQGEGLVAALRGTSVASAGAIRVAAAAGAALAPLAWCIANPSGPIEDAAFERISALICAALSRALDAGGIDGIYLDLHGAAVSESFPDAEGELLRRVRAIAGPDMPLTISLDPHANLTAEMVARVDALVPYRTYPHVDMKEAGAQAMQLLLERIRRRAPWARAFRQLDFLIPITSQCTLAEPMRSVMAERTARAVRTGVVELAFCFGFPYADFAGCGPAVAAFAATQSLAETAVAAFAVLVSGRESAFGLGVVGAAEAVAEALRAAPLAANQAASRPVVIADTQDNPGGGGHGDTTGLLAELVAQRAEGAVLCLINDADSAAQCHQAGEGARLRLDLGGKSDGAPFACEARVLRLSDGRFTLTGPMAAGNPADLGPTALVAIDPGIRVVVVSRKMQAYDQAILRHLGIEPGRCRILALKSSVHFRADFGPLAERVIVAAAPGPVVADPAILPFRHLRPGLRLGPSPAEEAKDQEAHRAARSSAAGP
ncbi:MAG: M81 family metallopeptidase [Alphaproteobacteria bacterium]|nr:M81 family metallopeptidase [Alphaproteobacteria bacterium]